MDSLDKVIVVAQDGKEQEVEVVTFLNSKDNMNQYLVFFYF